MKKKEFFDQIKKETFLKKKYILTLNIKTLTTQMFTTNLRLY